MVLRSTRVVTPEGTRPATVAVAGGTIDAVLPYDTEVPAGARLEDFGDDVLLPGLVDTHVHVNDPGRTEWEGFWTATRAAAAGGITTLLDMPLNSLPPTTTVENLRIKQQVAAPKAHVDTGFWGGALPSNVKDLRPLYEAGVFGFKCFLSPSGVEEFPELDQEQLARSLAEIAGFGGLLIVHAEDPHHLADAPQRPGPGTHPMSATASRPAPSGTAGAGRFARPLLGAFLVAAAVDLTGLLAGLDTVHLVAKPLLMPLLAAYAAVRGGPRPLIAALLFGWGGDVFLLADNDLAFLLGMGSFAVGHVCYLTLFGRGQARTRASLAAGIAYAVVLAVFLVLIWSDLPAELRVPVAGYSLLLTAMAWRAGVLGRYAAAGGALFLLSDALIATGIAEWPRLPAPDFWVMLTYIAAQLLLALGVLRVGRGGRP
nr:lysoplasmalogenase family protein [Streptomyces sp. SID2119]